MPTMIWLHIVYLLATTTKLPKPSWLWRQGKLWQTKHSSRNNLQSAPPFSTMTAGMLMFLCLVYWWTGLLFAQRGFQKCDVLEVQVEDSQPAPPMSLWGLSFSLLTMHAIWSAKRVGLSHCSIMRYETYQPNSRRRFAQTASYTEPGLQPLIAWLIKHSSFRQPTLLTLLVLTSEQAILDYSTGGICDIRIFHTSVLKQRTICSVAAREYQEMQVWCQDLGGSAGCFHTFGLFDNRWNGTWMHNILQTFGRPASRETQLSQAILWPWAG